MARRIIFNEETINAIREFVEVGKHNIAQTANRFNVSTDTIRRVMYENNIHTDFQTKRSVDWNQIAPDKIEEVVKLYSCTDITMSHLCKRVKLENYIVQEILRRHFSEEEINQRKARIYRSSKLSTRNPMYGKKREQSPQWKGGVVSDGQGYLMVQKPEWYTGRAGSEYVFQHSVVMCEALGITEIPKGFVVHHIDHNPLNNDINNLTLLSISAHSKLHAIEKKMMIAQGSETIRNGVDESRNA